MENTPKYENFVDKEFVKAAVDQQIIEDTKEIVKTTINEHSNENLDQAELDGAE